MRGEKCCPPQELGLPEAGGSIERSKPSGPSEHGKLTSTVERYARLKRAQSGVVAYIRGNTVDAEFGVLADRLECCGTWLKFREYLRTGRVQLSEANFCDAHLLCVLCAAARSRYLVARYLPSIFSDPSLGHYFLTLTFPPSARPVRDPSGAPADEAEIASLRSMLALGECAIRKLWERRRRKSQGPFRDVSGMIVSTEVSREGAGVDNGWHVHFHCVVSLPRGKRVDASELRREWFKLTQGKQLHLDPLKGSNDLREAFKYAFKPLDVSGDGRAYENGLKWRLLAFKGLRRQRLIRSYGCYHGLGDVEPSESVGSDPSDLGDWLEWLARWMGDSYFVQSAPVNGCEREEA